jgi:hypothetical protein
LVYPEETFGGGFFDLTGMEIWGNLGAEKREGIGGVNSIPDSRCWIRELLYGILGSCPFDVAQGRLRLAGIRVGWENGARDKI